MCAYPMRIPLNNATKIPLCINCKYYIPPSGNGIHYTKDKKMGFCQKSGTVHIVDGTIEYENVELYRKYNCKGTFYEDIDPSVTPTESMDFMSY